jgi:hypothetical protein
MTRGIQSRFDSRFHRVRGPVLERLTCLIDVAVVVSAQMRRQQWLTFCPMSRKDTCELAVTGRVAESSRLLPALLGSVRL